MAKHKKSFVAYSDWIDTFIELSDEDAGKLAKHLFKYVNDLDPDPETLLVKMCFIPMQQTLKRDLKKWTDGSDNRKDRARTAGLASAKAKQLKATQGNSVVESSTKSTVSVSVSVSGNDITNKEKIGKIQEKFYNSLIPFVDKFGKEEIRKFYEYWSEPNKSKTKIKFQLEKTWDANLRLHRWTKNNFNNNGEVKRKDEGYKRDFIIHRTEN